MNYSNNQIDNFKNFLLSEYSNIAQAHFKSIESISSFFRYYLLIMSIPISVFIIITKNQKDGSLNVTNFNSEILSLILLVISIAGIGVFCYIMNLRFDVVLYARVVNGIRKFFFDKYKEDLNFKLRLRVLPQNPQMPPLSMSR